MDKSKKLASVIIEKLRSLNDKQKAKEMTRYFKTGYGEYAENDVFLGIGTQDIRNIAKQHFKETNLSQTALLLQSKYHEVRRAGIEILVQKMEKENDDHKRQKILFCYLNNIDGINNWDLVDASAPHLLGAFIYNKDKTILYDFVVSDNLWKQRIAIISTLYFIRKGNFEDTLAIAEMFMDNKYDLIHKAVGWMLREVGKRDVETELKFLDKYAAKLPRTALRYALEKFDEDLREYYMNLTEE
ncbi:MAG: DNA alkylation repair protein [Prevotellaceae bacterium]|jgi:3-methyladenine DNA glycosylase AlkD|nr:DNA alkylation repair protein [Prevotellaceae bacterium]